LLRDFHDLALAAEARQYLDEAEQEDIAGHKKEKEKPVVKKPLAKLPVPVNSFVRSVEPSAGAAFGDGPVAPKSSTSCKNPCTVLMGPFMKLSRSSSRGMPSGSLAAQVRAGPEMAVPKPTIVPKNARISSSDAIVRGTCKSTNMRKAGCSSSLRTIAKINGNTISLAT
jgi:hypothetical protein